MNTIFITRGNVDKVNLVLKHLSTIPMNLPIKNKDGTSSTLRFYGSLQPIQLWSYVHPEGYKDAVHKTLFEKAWDYGKNGTWMQKRVMDGLRKALKAKEIPAWNPKSPTLLLPEELKDIAITPIGMIEDDLNFQDSNGTTHEGI